EDMGILGSVSASARAGGGASAPVEESGAGRAPAPVEERAGGAVGSYRFTRFMIVLAVFTLGNSTDAFLLLKLTDTAGGVRLVPLVWSALHVVKAAVSVVGGSWSDRIGRRTVIGTGWLVYAVVYAGFAASRSLVTLTICFLTYGFYFGLAEGTEKALIADLVPSERRGLAFGIYNAVLGLGALAASLVFGLIWRRYGPAAA